MFLDKNLRLRPQRELKHQFNNFESTEPNPKSIMLQENLKVSYLQPGFQFWN